MTGRCFALANTHPGLGCILWLLLTACDSKPVPQVKERAPGAPDNVLLVTIDTTRADHVGCYGGDPRVTPTIDRLAKSGVVFDRAYTPVPITLPSHTTMLTGEPPFIHGVRSNGLYKVPSQAVTVPEQLQEAGYHTLAFPSAEVLFAKYGLDQGFEVYNDQLGSGNQAIAMRGATQTSALVKDWIRNELEEPFFLWVHFFDPHAPYEEPADLRGKLNSAYDAEIHHVDRNLDGILQSLDGRGALDRTWVWVTSDHGEGLGEHNEDTHAVFLYEATLRVPLIVAHPSLEPGRVETPVSLLDLAPTMLDMVGAPPLPCSGKSMAGLLRGEQPNQNHPIYVESYFGYVTYGWSPLEGLVTENLKFIHAPTPELYDLLEDPGELVSNWDPTSDVGSRIASSLQQLKSQAPPPMSQEFVVLDEEAAQNLVALGYTAMGGAEALQSELPPPGLAAGPDPKDRAHVLADLYNLFDAARLNQGERLLSLCARILAADPDNIMALKHQGTQLVQMGRYADAIPPLQAIYDRKLSSPASLQALGVALMRSDRVDEAVLVLDECVARSLDTAKPMNFLAEAEARRGNLARASELIRRILDEHDVPDDARRVLEERLEGMKDQ